MFQGGFKSVSRVFQECFKSVSRVFQECFKGASSMFHECFKGFQRYFKGVLSMCQGSIIFQVSFRSGYFKKLSKVRQECQEAFSKQFQASFRRVSSRFQGCFMNILWMLGLTSTDQIEPHFFCWLSVVCLS